MEAVAQIKVKSGPESILTAVEQFLTKPPEGPSRSHEPDRRHRQR
ncbi:hypothetical protein SBA4_3250004 [Candidatus Sulfopaludibacter sp. SbA4]|nr:hypothetical protein SBA4_3250004 [Candidatus Sulfopaludibacter sp. SbA4]